MDDLCRGKWPYEWLSGFFKQIDAMHNTDVTADRFGALVDGMWPNKAKVSLPQLSASAVGVPGVMKVRRLRGPVQGRIGEPTVGASGGLEDPGEGLGRGGAGGAEVGDDGAGGAQVGGQAAEFEPVG